MHCSDYIISMNFNTIETRTRQAYRKGLLSDSCYNTIVRAIETCQKEKAKSLAPHVNSSIAKLSAIDALRILDEMSIRLIDSKRNVMLVANSTDLVNALANYDIKMKSTMPVEAMKYLVLVAAVVAANYATLLGKKVESETMMGLSLDLDKKQLIKNFENAQDMLDHLRHFNLNKMDGSVMHIEQPKQSGTVSTVHRAW